MSIRLLFGVLALVTMALCDKNEGETCELTEKEANWIEKSPSYVCGEDRTKKCVRKFTSVKDAKLYLCNKERTQRDPHWGVVFEYNYCAAMKQCETKEDDNFNYDNRVKPAEKCELSQKDANWIEKTPAYICGYNSKNKCVRKFTSVEEAKKYICNEDQTKRNENWVFIYEYNYCREAKKCG